MTTLIIKATYGNYNVLGKLRFTLMYVKKQLIVRKYIDINVHEKHGYKCT
jgi:hypothetical protein